MGRIGTYGRVAAPQVDPSVCDGIAGIDVNDLDGETQVYTVLAVRELAADLLTPHIYRMLVPENYRTFHSDNAQRGPSVTSGDNTQEPASANSSAGSVSAVTSLSDRWSVLRISSTTAGSPPPNPGKPPPGNCLRWMVGLDAVSQFSKHRYSVLWRGALTDARDRARA